MDNFNHMAYLAHPGHDGLPSADDLIRQLYDRTYAATSYAIWSIVPFADRYYGLYLPQGVLGGLRDETACFEFALYGGAAKAGALSPRQYLPPGGNPLVMNNYIYRDVHGIAQHDALFSGSQFFGGSILDSYNHVYQTSPGEVYLATYGDGDHWALWLHNRQIVLETFNRRNTGIRCSLNDYAMEGAPERYVPVRGLMQLHYDVINWMVTQPYANVVRNFP